MRRSEQDAAELIETVCRGDQEALTALFDRFADRVYGIALSVLRCPADAEEVCSEVFGKVWMCAERFDPERGSAEAWLSVIARNCSLDRIRRNARHARQVPWSADQLADSNLADHNVPESWLEERVFRSAVVDALDSLSRGQRRVIRLSLLQGLSQQEIAQALRMPLGTVKSHCRRGLLRMRSALNCFDPARQ